MRLEFRAPGASGMPLATSHASRLRPHASAPYNSPLTDKPRHLDLKKDDGLTVHWAGGGTSYYPVAYLRRMSPSAEARMLREQLASNPLTVLPGSAAGGKEPLRAVNAELVGNYAIRIRFSDGHDTGIYSWSYLREIDPNRPAEPDP